MENEVITITESQIKEIIAEVVQKLLNEGIDIDLNRNVTMTDKHEKLVNTSLENNPTYSDQIIDGVRVWSIFQRKQGLPSDGDGNPMLYALKKEKNYVMTNPKVVNTRIEAIANKFSAMNQGLDVTIMVPSSNSLNKYFANIIGRKCNNPVYISDVLVKMTIEEVDDFIFEQGSAFRKYYGKKFLNAYQIFKNYCNRMPNGFQFHKIADLEMRKVIENTIKLNDQYYGKYIDAINDKNVVIVDDSITLGQSLKESYNIIQTYYSPKSISVVTLFSPLYDSEGKNIVK